jgi:hypothetical protein
LPHERRVTLDLPPIQLADDAVEAQGSVLNAVSTGMISPNEGAALSTVIKSLREAIDLADVVRGLDALDAEMRGLRHGW